MRENIVCWNIKMQIEGAFPGFSPLLNCHLINYGPFILRLTCCVSLSLSPSLAVRLSLTFSFLFFFCISLSFHFLPTFPSSLSLWRLCSEDTLRVLSPPVKWNGRVSFPFYSANIQLPVRWYSWIRRGKKYSLQHLNNRNYMLLYILAFWKYPIRNWRSN